MASKKLLKLSEKYTNSRVFPVQRPPLKKYTLFLLLYTQDIGE